MKNKTLISAVIIGLLNTYPSSSLAVGGSYPDLRTLNVETHFSLSKTLKSERNYVMMKKVIKQLKSRVNKTPYVFSGSSVYGWDCSGMVRWAYTKFGLELPHSADKQGHLGVRVSKPKLGDIVVFAYQNSTNFYHSGIYVGNGQVVNANRYFGTTVVEPLTNFKRSQIRFIRIVETPSKVRG